MTKHPNTGNYTVQEDIFKKMKINRLSTMFFDQRTQCYKGNFPSHDLSSQHDFTLNQHIFIELFKILKFMWNLYLYK